MTGLQEGRGRFGNDSIVSERLDDRMVRIAAFQYLDKLQQQHGDVLPWTALAKGFNFAVSRSH